MMARELGLLVALAEATLLIVNMRLVNASMDQPAELAANSPTSNSCKSLGAAVPLLLASKPALDHTTVAQVGGVVTLGLGSAARLVDQLRGAPVTTIGTMVLLLAPPADQPPGLVTVVIVTVVLAVAIAGMAGIPTMEAVANMAEALHPVPALPLPGTRPRHPLPRHTPALSQGTARMVLLPEWAHRLVRRLVSRLRLRVPPLVFPAVSTR